MPITRRQFELEIDTKIEDWMGKISHFLLEHKDEAFTEEELYQYWGIDPFDFLERQPFDLALEKLVEIQAAGKRMIRGTNYYAFIE